MFTSRSSEKPLEGILQGRQGRILESLEYGICVELSDQSKASLLERHSEMLPLRLLQGAPQHRHRPRYSLFFLLGTPKKVSLIMGNPQIQIVGSEFVT